MNNSPETLSILVVEDNKVNQLMIRKMLEKLSMQPTVVNDGQEAVDWLQQQSADIVLMDLMMPNMDGVVATRHIRAMKDIEQPKIIALTASANEYTSDDCMEAGMDAYLTKPVTVAILNEVIQQHVKA